MKLRKGKTRKQAQAQVKRIAGKKAARGRASAEKKAMEMSTKVMEEFMRIKAEQGVDAANAFLRKKGFKGPIF